MRGLLKAGGVNSRLGVRVPLHPSIGKPELPTRAIDALQFLPVQFNPLHDGNEVEPKVFQGRMVFSRHEAFLKAGVQRHQLMDEVRHLHELEVILKCAVTFPGVLVFHAVAPVFQRVEAFILDFPPQTPSVAGVGNVSRIDGQVGDMHKACRVWLLC